MAYEEKGTEKQRIIQELVPGKQVSLAHVIANPDAALFEKLGMHPREEDHSDAIGVMTISPGETAIIIADVASKAAGISLEYVDHRSGSLIITGTVSEVEAAVSAVLDYSNRFGFSVCSVTKT